MPEKNYTSKVCRICKVEKSLSEFYRHPSSKDGFQGLCRSCHKDRVEAYAKTKNGLVTNIYRAQRDSSKRRGCKAPNYTNQELRKWLFDKPKFHRLYDLWVESGCKKMERPSVDRLNDYKSYSFDNIQLITWRENNEKGHSDRKAGVNNKHSKQVDQISLDGRLIASYYSTRQACRVTGVYQSNISSCCNGKLKTAGGFKWLYKLA